VAANDPAVEASAITFPGEGVTIQAYQAKPRGNGPFPLVLICHENRGLNDHIRDVARRFAKEGYLASAVDLLSREGGTDKVADPAQVPALLSGAPPERHVGDFQSALKYYMAQPIARSGAYAMNGYCFGGGITWRTATKTPELKAIVPFYGGAPPLSDAPNIKAAVFAVYSSDPQDGASRGKEELEALLRQSGVTIQAKVYPDTFHAFHNDSGARYNQAQALAAWKDMLDWFARYVKA
jgi:carboxymethylenebutenolidase